MLMFTNTFCFFKLKLNYFVCPFDQSPFIITDMLVVPDYTYDDS